MIKALIDTLGGQATVAAACKISTGAVYKWVNGPTPHIPPKHWATLRAMSKGKITLNKLHEINAAQEGPTAI